MSNISNSNPNTITVIANGQPREVQVESTIMDLLQEVSISPMRVVVQLDGVIVPRSDFENTALQEGCKLEIVTLVGGG